LSVEPVFGLVKDGRLRRLDNLFGYLLTAFGGKAMEEDRLGPGGGEEGRVDLIWGEDLLTIHGFGFLAHARPDVGVDNV